MFKENPNPIPVILWNKTLQTRLDLKCGMGRTVEWVSIDEWIKRYIRRYKELHGIS
jgi:hypothetical protein